MFELKELGVGTSTLYLRYSASITGKTIDYVDVTDLPRVLYLPRIIPTQLTYDLPERLG